jgi:hypothetical protein
MLAAVALAVFCLRLAAGMIGCLLLLSPTILNPRFYRTHFLTALALGGVAMFCVRSSLTDAGWPLLALLVAGLVLSFAGSLLWAFEGAPGARLVTALTALVLAGSLCLLETDAPLGQPLASRLLADLTSAGVLGTAITAMLLGHSYLISPSLSIRPLRTLLAALAVAVLARLAVDGYDLACWTGGHPLGRLKGDVALWLPLRWALGFAAPLALDWMAWQTARIRSTQSATGILYVVVIFCFLGELTGQLLSATGLAA